jgi:hypothetical protein
MDHSTSASYTAPSPPGTPTEAETRHRQAFQVVHFEVGFRFLDGQWVAYWAGADCTPQHRTAATLGKLLKKLAEVFGEPEESG